MNNFNVLPGSLARNALARRRCDYLDCSSFMPGHQNEIGRNSRSLWRDIHWTYSQWQGSVPSIMHRKEQANVQVLDQLLGFPIGQSSMPKTNSKNNESQTKNSNQGRMVKGTLVSLWLRDRNKTIGKRLLRLHLNLDCPFNNVSRTRIASWRPPFLSSSSEA